MGAVLALLAVVPSALCLENGLARTPSMGFNTWNAFGSDISEQLITQTAGFMVNMSLVKMGYSTIVLDGARSAQRHCRNSAGGHLRAVLDYLMEVRTSSTISKASIAWPSRLNRA